jgi:predicted ATPase
VVRAESRPARELSRQLDALAEAAHDPHLRLQSCHAIWTALVADGDLLNARARLEEGSRLYQRAEHAALFYAYGGHDPGVCALAFDGFALWALGYPDRALISAREALALARGLSHPVSIGQALCYTAMVHQLRREAAAARSHARESVAVTQDRGLPQFLSYGNVLHGWALAQLDAPAAGLAEIRAGLAAASATSNRFFLPHWLALLADALCNEKRADEGLAAVEEGMGEVKRWGQSYSESELHRLRGQLLLSQGDAANAEGSFRQAIAVARRQSARSFELRAALGLARLLDSREGGEQARAELEKVCDWFTEGFDTADLVEARALLAKP